MFWAQNAMRPGVSITSCAAVPAVRETLALRGSMFLYKMI